MAAVPRRSPAPPLRWLRRALLVAMALGLAVVGGLFWLGRTASPEPELEGTLEPSSAILSGESKEEADATLLSEGFDYEQRVEGEPVFRLQGERFVTDREGLVRIEEVDLELFRGGEPYRVSSERAVYSPATGDAQLLGRVEVSGGAGWRLSCEQLETREGGKVLASSGGSVGFARGELLDGRADRLRYDLESERLEVDGDVVLEGRLEERGPELALAAESLRWDRQRNAIAIAGGARLDWGAHRIEAREIDAQLREDEGGLEGAEARGEVRGRLLDDREGEVRTWSALLGVQFDPETASPARALLAAPTPERARAELRAPGAPLRVVEAPRLLITLAGGRPTELDASGGTRIEEDLPGGQRRTIAGGMLRAAFSTEGALDRARFSRDVTLQDDRLSAAGDRLTVEGEGERTILEGSPARARSARGTLSAARIVHERDREILRAEGNVRARLEQEAGGLPGSSRHRTPPAPTDVEAEEAEVAQRDEHFEFRGRVQAVRGDALLFADRLAGDPNGGRTTATGSVRTVWTGAPADEAAGEQVVVTAESLVHDRGASDLLYSGGVRVRQGAREISGEQVRVLLGADGEARRMLAEGAVRVSDRQSGRTVEGLAADYDLLTRSAVVTGSPVVLRESSGTILRGRRAFFDLATGDARLLGEGEPQ
jgi:lipopolysaccharide export system protein LptA